MSCDIGFRVFTEINRPDPKLVEKFRGLPSSNIGDMMNRLYCMHAYIRSINGKPMVGSAFTVKAPIGDNAVFHLALDMAQPGDIIVVDGGSAVNRSLCGEIMFTYAQTRGIAGIVVDGAIRDADSTSELSIPIYAKAVTPQGPFKNGPGEINVPIACGGQVVFPGDILVGDADGIVVVRRQEAEMVAEMAINKFNTEKELLDMYHTGTLDASEHESTYRKLLINKGMTIHE